MTKRKNRYHTQRWAADRTVHATYNADPECLEKYRVEIVRYDNAGKWFIEYAEGRKHLTVTAAAAWARHGMAKFGGSVVLGLHGGSTFDRLIQSGRLSEHLHLVPAL